MPIQIMLLCGEDMWPVLLCEDDVSLRRDEPAALSERNRPVKAFDFSLRKQVTLA